MIRKFQRQDLEAAVKIWLAANKEAHDFIDPCYWEGYKDAVKEMFLQAEIYVFETEDMMEEIFDETGGILGFIGLGYRRSGTGCLHEDKWCTSSRRDSG